MAAEKATKNKQDDQTIPPTDESRLNFHPGVLIPADPVRETGLNQDKFADAEKHDKQRAQDHKDELERQDKVVEAVKDANSDEVPNLQRGNGGE